MSEAAFFRAVLIASFVCGGGVFVTLFFVPAPYGRHSRRGWGPQLPNWLGWTLMESVSALGMLLMFIVGEAPRTTATAVFLLLWEAHYFHRAFLYPFLLRDRKKSMPLAVTLMGMTFNLVNIYLNGRYLFHFAGDRYAATWLQDPRFYAGIATFALGLVTNHWADHTLRGLRRSGEGGYKVPHGGLYRYISCPNYFGEIVEWTGWALATWSLPGLSFALWTVANLAPRAWSHHRWYRENFPAYPMERKALIPGVW